MPDAPTKPRKPSVAHVDCLKFTITAAVPIDAMDQDSLKAANLLVNAAVKVLRDGKASAEVDAKLGRERGDKFP